MSDEVVVFGNQYAVIPEWVLYSSLSDRAIRLYAVLGRYVGSHDKGWPSRASLGKRINCSTSSIDRAVTELEEFGAIRVEERRRPNGSRTSSYFYLLPNPTSDVRVEPNITRDEGASSPVTTPEGTLKEGTLTNVSSTHNPPGSEKWSDDVKTLTSLLCDWNILNGYKAFTLGPKQWSDMDKLLRIDNHTADEIGQVIEWCQRDPFWNANIRSTFKLRKQYDSLVGRMRQEGISLGPKPPNILCPDDKHVALIFDCYDQGEEWYFEGTGELLFDNPSAFGYTRPRDDQGNMIDANGNPYRLDAQGRRTRVGA